MILLFPPIFAQAYGCDGYGQASYNNCPSQSDSSSSDSTSSATSATTPSAKSDTSTSTQSESSDQSLQTTPDQTSSSSLQTASPTQQSQPANATVGFDMILLFSILGAVLIALILWLIAKHRRKHKQVPPTDFTNLGGGGGTPPTQPPYINPQ